MASPQRGQGRPSREKTRWRHWRRGAPAALPWRTSSGGAVMPPRPMYRAMAMQADSAVPVAAGEESVAADVSVVWEIR